MRGLDGVEKCGGALGGGGGGDEDEGVSDEGGAPALGECQCPILVLVPKRYGAMNRNVEYD